MIYHLRKMIHLSFAENSCSQATPKVHPSSPSIDSREVLPCLLVCSTRGICPHGWIKVSSHVCRAPRLSSPSNTPKLLL